MATYGIGEPNEAEKVFSPPSTDSSSFLSIGERASNAARSGIGKAERKIHSYAFSIVDRRT